MSARSVSSLLLPQALPELARGTVEAGQEVSFAGFPITERHHFPPEATTLCWVYLTLNSEIALSWQRNPVLQSLIGQPRVRVSVDGQWIWWGLRRKYPRQALTKLAGSDLIFKLAAHCARHAKVMLLLGGTNITNAVAVEVLRARCPGLHVVGHVPGRYRLGTLEEQAATTVALDVIRLCRPDYVVLGLGAEKEQHFAHAMAPALDGLVTGLLCFGGAIDLASGLVRRAPRWLQCLGLEGPYRVLQQPARLGRFLRVLRILPTLISGRY